MAIRELFKPGRPVADSLGEVRAKYPELADLDDRDLKQTIGDVYPDLISQFEPAKPVAPTPLPAAPALKPAVNNTLTEARARYQIPDDVPDDVLAEVLSERTGQEIEVAPKPEEPEESTGFIDTAKSGALRLVAGAARLPDLAFKAATFMPNLAWKAIRPGEALAVDMAVDEMGARNKVAGYLEKSADSLDYTKKRWSDKGEDFETLLKKGDKSEIANYVAHQVVANAPLQIALLAGTIAGAGPATLAAIGSTTAAQTWAKTQKDSAASSDKRFLNAVVNGAMEAGFESLGTVGIAEKILKPMAKRFAAGELKDILKEAGKAIVISVAGEANEEAVTELGQSLSAHVFGIDPNAMKGIGYRMLNSGLIGGISGGAITAPVVGASAAVQAATPKSSNLSTIDSGVREFVKTAIPEVVQNLATTELPVTPERLETELIKATIKAEEAVKAGADPVNAQRQAAVSLIDSLHQQSVGAPVQTEAQNVLSGTIAEPSAQSGQPATPTTPAKSPETAQGSTIQGVVASMGLEPFQLPYSTFKRVYGNSRPEAEIQQDFRTQVRTAITEGKAVPDAVVIEMREIKPPEPPVGAAEPSAAYAAIEPEDANDLNTRAVEKFGTTKDLSRSGFLLNDGRLVNFSRPNERPMIGRRTLDHTNIQRILDLENPVEGFEAVMDFLTRTGAIRTSFDFKNLMVQSVGTPSEAQIKELTDQILETKPAKIYMELTDPNGRHLRSEAVENPTPDDIERFYRGKSVQLEVRENWDARLFEGDATTKQLSLELGVDPKNKESEETVAAIEPPLPPERGTVTLPNGNKEELFDSLFSVELREKGSLTFPTKKVTSPADVAYAFRFLTSEQRENIFIGAMKDGRVIAVEHLGIGTIDQVAAYPREIITLLSKMGADSFFLVHNHPSGYTDPSQEDIRLTNTMKYLGEAVGVQLYGHVVIDDTKFGFIDGRGNVAQYEHTAVTKKNKVKIFEKFYEWKEGATKQDLKNRPVLSSPDKAFELFKGIQKSGDETVVYFLNTQNQILKALIIPKGALDLKFMLQQGEAFRAAGIITINSGLPATRTVAYQKELSSAGFQYLDDLVVKENGFESRKEYGFLEPKSTYSVAEPDAPSFREKPEDFGDAQEPLGGDINFDPDKMENPEGIIDVPNLRDERDDITDWPLPRPEMRGAEGLNPITNPSIRRTARDIARDLRDQAIDALDPLVRFVIDNGKVRPYKEGAEREEFENSVPLWARQFQKDLGRPADEMAQEAFNAGLLEDASDKELLDRLGRLPRRLPRIADFMEEATRMLEQELPDFRRVQPGLAKQSDRVTGVLPADRESYQARKDLRFQIQRQIAAASDADKAARNTVTSIKLRVNRALEILPEAERAKFMDAVAKIKSEADAQRVIDAGIRRFEAVQKEAILQNEEKRAADYKDLATFMRRLQTATKRAALTGERRLNALKKDVANLIKEKLPADAQGKFIDALANVRTPAQVIKVADRINDQAKRSQRQRLIQSIKSNYAKIRASGNIAIDYKQKIDELMSGYLTSKPLAQTMERLEKLNDAIYWQGKEGKEIELPLYMVKQLQKFMQRPLASLEIAELQDLAGEIETLAELGRTKFRVRLELDRLRKDRDMKDLLEGSAPLDSIPERRAIRPGEKLSLPDKIQNVFKRFRDAALHVKSAITPTDVIFDILDDNADFQGPNFRIFKTRIDSAWNKYLDSRDFLRDEITDKARTLDLKQENFERIGVYALDVQEGGREKLLNNGLTDAEIDAIVLSDKEMAFYQFMRERLDLMLPAIQKTMKDLYNAPVGQVKNYFPFMTDWEMMEPQDVQDRMAVELAGLTKKTETGFTQKRKGPGEQRVNIDALDVYLKHLDDAIYLTQMGEDIKYLSELANRPQYREAVGALGQRLVREWLDTMARKGGAGQAQRLAFLDRARKSLGAAQFSFKLATALIQPTSIANGAGLIGNYAFTGASKILDREWRQFLMEKFPEIRNRIGDDQAFLDFRGESLFEKTTRIGLTPMQKLDQFAAASVAAGAYLKYLDDHDLSLDFSNPDPKGIAYAQRIVRRSQASGQFKDAPLALTRGRLTGNLSIDRLLLQFQTFMLNEWSLINHELWDAGIKKGKLGKGAQLFIWMMLATAAENGMRYGSQLLLDSFIGHDDDEEFNLPKEMGLDFIRRVPFIGQMMSAIMYDRIGVPVLDAIGSGLKGLGQLATGKTELSKAKGAVRVAGAIGRGLPAIILPGFPALPGTVQLEQLALRSMKKEKTKRGAKSLSDL